MVNVDTCPAAIAKYSELCRCFSLSLYLVWNTNFEKTKQTIRLLYRGVQL